MLLSLHVSRLASVKPIVRLLLLATTLAVSAAGADRELAAVLKAVETRYNSATSLQVLFKEDSTAPAQLRRTESGRLTLLRPGKMRWDYDKPKGKVWVSDGKQHNMYLPDENRVETGPMKETEDLRAPLAFLLGKLHFEKEFRNLASQKEADGSLRITGDPASDALPYSWVQFVVSPQDQITEVKVLGVDKSLLDYHFDQEKRNIPVDSKMFQFKIPAGAEVVRMEQ